MPDLTPVLRLCELCGFPAKKPVWSVAPNLMLCPICVALPSRDFHERVIDRYWSEVYRLYPAVPRD